MGEKLKNILIPVLCVVLALIIGAGIILYLGKDPLLAYKSLIMGAFSNKYAIAQTLIMTTPLIFTGLAISFAFRAGLFNIGAQGQVIAGGLAAAAVGAFVTGPLLNNIVLALIAAAAAGFMWAALAGVLKAKLGVHEVISTIMLNYIAIKIENFMLNNMMKDGGHGGAIPQTPVISEAAKLPAIIADTNVNAGLIIAVICALIVWFIFNRTILGYEIKAVGFNKGASENGGISVSGKIIIAMGISGMLAAMAGAERVLGGIGQDRYISGLMAEYGFDGIAVALLGKNNPFGIILAALLFGTLRAGAMMMQFEADIPSQIIIIIQAVIILLIASENVFRALFRRKKEANK